MRIVQLGQMLGQFLPGILLNSNMSSHLELRRPPCPMEWRSLMQCVSLSIEFSSVGNPKFALKGSLYHLPEEKTEGLLLFLGLPMVLTSNDLLQLNLTIADLPAHDARRELVMQTEELMLATGAAQTHDEAQIAWQEELTRQRDVAASAQQSQAVFTAKVTHELRTPLNGIIGMTELLLATDVTSAQADMLGCVERSGKELLAMINDILDFSEVSGGSFAENKVPLNLRQCLYDCVAAFSAQALQKDRKLDVSCSFAPGSEVLNSVLADGDRLGQIVRNLVKNSLKSVPPDNGSISVHTECVWLPRNPLSSPNRDGGLRDSKSYSPKSKASDPDTKSVQLAQGHYLTNMLEPVYQARGSFVVPQADERLLEDIRTPAPCKLPYALISVKDNGIGVPDEKRSLLFLPFSQIGTETRRQTRKNQGTGLGLSIVKGIAESLGGAAWIAKETKVGAEFLVALPVVTCQEVLESSKSPPRNFANLGLRALILEQHGSADLLQNVLQTLGVDCHINAPPEKISQLDDLNLSMHSLVILGIPPHSGLAQWRLVDRLCELMGNLVVITAYQGDSDAQEAAEERELALLSKPLKQSNICSTFTGLFKARFKPRPMSVFNFTSPALARSLLSPTARAPVPFPRIGSPGLPASAPPSNNTSPGHTPSHLQHPPPMPASLASSPSGPPPHSQKSPPEERTAVVSLRLPLRAIGKESPTQQHRSIAQSPAHSPLGSPVLMKFHRPVPSKERGTPKSPARTGLNLPRERFRVRSPEKQLVPSLRITIDSSVMGSPRSSPREPAATGVPPQVTECMNRLKAMSVLQPSDPSNTTPRTLARRKKLGAKKLAAECPLKILFVDDNEINVKVGCLMLRNMGYELKQDDIARDGVEALACLRTRPYDLVLMDIQMPNMSGLEATAALRRNEGNAFRLNIKTKVVAVSASLVGENLTELGLDGHILKPVSRDTLEASIRAAHVKLPSSSPQPSPSSAGTRRQ